MGFDRQDLLRGSGLSEGNRLTDTIRLHTQGSESTSSGSFTALSASRGRALTDLGNVAEDATVELRLLISTGVTMAADGDYRLELTNDQGTDFLTPTLTVQAGDTFTQAASDTVELAGSGLSDILFEFRSDGTNTITVFQIAAQLEVVL